jgi:alkylation response protein AidB-like acyl-CoA dehydrogenase
MLFIVRGIKMEFSYNQKQLDFMEKIKKDIIPNIDGKVDNSFNQQSSFNKEDWQKIAGYGIQGGLIPKKYGGIELDLMTYISGLESLGELYKDSGLLFSLCAHVFACELTILNSGTETQKDKWLPHLVSGRNIAAIAIAETEGASDAFNMNTVADQVDGGYIVNGTKSYVTNAPFCDLILLFAKDLSTQSIICLVIDNINNINQKNLQIEPIEKLGMRTAPFGKIVFKDLFVPEENLLGKKNAGKILFLSAMEWERGCILAPIVGRMTRQLGDTISYIKNRKQGAVGLNQHQVINHRIVDMHMRLELSRLMLYRFAWEKQTKRRANIHASMAKLYIAEAFTQNSLDAMQLHGAYGYTLESDREKELRDSLAVRIASGTSDIQKNIIGKWLGL